MHKLKLLITRERSREQVERDREMANRIAWNCSLLTEQREELDRMLLERLLQENVKFIRPCEETWMSESRKSLIEDVDSYLDDFEKPNILWITGHPGVGKSALMSIITSHLHDRLPLVSGFAFDDAGVLTPSALWRHIAYSLARWYPDSIGQHILRVLRAGDLTLDGNETFECLIKNPLQRSLDTLSDSQYVVMIDGLLDYYRNCSGDSWGQKLPHIHMLLEALKQWRQLPANFKLIIASRDEVDIKMALSPISHPLHILSGFLVTSEISDDIRKFFREHFRRIANNSEYLDDDWPGLQVIDTFTARAAGLFIWARAVVDYIRHGDPASRLRNVIDQTVKLGSIVSTYSLVMERHFLDLEPDELHCFRILTGTMILARQPFSHADCHKALPIAGTMLESLCMGLRTVMDPGGSLRFAHQSFVDFLLSEDCPPRFRIDLESQYLRFAMQNINHVIH